MAIGTTMNLNNVDINNTLNSNTTNISDNNNRQQQQGENRNNDEHEHDMVMPGFRFHPTEEELIEFYLRRKVEGKRFNVELITFIDLYRYDPWNSLAEISLCRVYKRAGVEDHPPSSRATSERKNHHTAFIAQSSSLQQHQHQVTVTEQRPQQMEKVRVSETDASSSTEVGTALGLSHRSSYTAVSPIEPTQSQSQPPIMEVDRMMMHMQNHHQEEGEGSGRLLLLGGCNSSLIPSNNNHHPRHNQPSSEEIQGLVECQQSYFNHHFQQHQHQNQQQQLQFDALTSNANNNNNTNTNTRPNNAHLLFSNHLFSSQLQPPLLNNPQPNVGGSIGLQPLLPPATVATSGGAGGVGSWDWNPFPEPNRENYTLFNLD